MTLRPVSLPRRRWSSAPATAPDDVVYAIGDIHGRLDLFTELIDLIADDLTRFDTRQRGSIIVLGDVIDRGPDSKGLLTVLMRAERSLPGLEVLLGNHEAALLDSLAGDGTAQTMWLEYGGLATLASYGVAPPGADEAPGDFALRLGEALGHETIDWLEERPVFAASGDFFFCHAGVRPGIPLDRQGRDDLIWIREPFLGSTRYHGAVVVHGHTIEEEVCVRPNRIGIDTGAYRSGVLTALCLDGTTARLLQTPST